MKGIIVFVKNPELGKVKTRLAVTLGEEKALEIYNKLLGYTREVLMQVSDVKKIVYYSSFIDNEDDWGSDTFEKRVQSSGDLGERIISALQGSFQTCSPIVIIGSDCPQLTPLHIESAFKKLNENNIVIGPSHDGGYYLLGMDSFYPSLFKNINWSTSTVMEETISQAKNENLSFTKLETLTDIDHEEDWNKFGF